MMLDMLDEPYEKELDAFGEHWCFDGRYPHAEWVLVAVYHKEPDSDGQDVEVYCAAWPARFYRVDALPGQNSVGRELGGFSLATGSGMADTAALLATHIASGMLAVRAVD